MMHLTDDELYHLAELTNEIQPYNEQELQQMKHLETCKECYDKFCVALALAEVTSEEGYMLLSDIYELSENVETVPSLSERVLAVVNVVRKKAEDSLIAIVEQVDHLGTLMQLEPPLTFATRGIEFGNSSVYRLEDVDNEKTFVAYDANKNELLVQVGTKNLEVSEIKAYIITSDSELIEIPLGKKGNIYKGVLTDVPEKDFQIYIEEK